MNAKTPFSGCILVAIFAVGVSAQPAQSRLAPMPHTDLDAVQSVEARLRALADNDAPLPNSGVAAVFNFASPDNRSQTGPLDRFTLMLNSEPYRHLINHSQATVLPATTERGQQIVPVEIETPSGVEYRFVFVLSQQTDRLRPCFGCWMTDGVLAVDARADVPDGT